MDSKINVTSNDCSGTLDNTSIIILTCFNAISGIMAVTGNFLVLLAVHTTVSLQTISNYLICSLAVSDLLVGLIINPLLIAKTVYNVTTGGPLATIAEVASLLSITTTCLGLCSISIDRYVAIIHVFRYNELMTKKRCCILILFNWGFATVFSCSRFLVTSESDLPVLWIVSCIVDFVIPFTIIAYCYYVIFKEAASAKRRIGAANASEQRQATEATKNRKAARTIIIVIGVFVLLLAPNSVIAIIQNSLEDPCAVRRIYKLWFWFSFVTFCSSALDPWIYAIRNTEFRAAFQRILRLHKRHIAQDVSVASTHKSSIE